MTQDFKDHASQAAHLLAQVEASNRSSLPCAVTLGERHEIRHVNQAMAKFFGRSPQQLEARTFASLTLEPERAAALFGLALQTGVTESAADLVYAGDAGVTMFAATLVQRVEGLGQQATVVHLVDTTLVTRTRGALMLANEQLVLGSLRERDLADVAAQATLELERQLRRQSLLAGANALLSASLDLATTLHAAAALGVPELAECGIVRLLATGATPRIGVAHVDGESESELARLQLELAADPDLAALEAGVLQTRAPYRLRGLAQGAHASTSCDRSTRYVLRELGTHSALAVPILARGTMLGVLVLISVGDRDFAPADVECALELGARAGRALDNAQLLHEARQASRMREDVLAIVSHDLRSPLGAITMTVQLLLRSFSAREPPQARRGLELIQRSSEQMRRLIEELLEVADIQSGRLELQCAPVSLQALLGRALELLEEVALQKDVQLIRSIEPRKATKHSFVMPTE